MGAPGEVFDTRQVQEILRPDERIAYTPGTTHDLQELPRRVVVGGGLNSQQDNKVACSKSEPITLHVFAHKALPSEHMTNMQGNIPNYKNYKHTSQIVAQQTDKLRNQKQKVHAAHTR